MRALITGGAGFIGSHLAEHLLLHGHSVTVLDDLSTGSLENVAHLRKNPAFDCVVDTVTDDGVVGKLVEQSDAVFHLAAAVGVKLVMAAPIHTIVTNIHGTETVLRHANRTGTPVLVTSTSEVYGKGVALPYCESADLVLGPPQKTRWGYATSKLMDEFLALAYHKEHALPVTVVRLFNTVGPRQNSRYGMVIPTFVRQALAGEPITVHGDGSQTRSFTWVGDVVWALTALLDSPRARGEVFNVGNGAEVSVYELACRIKQLTGSSSEIRFQPYHQAFDASFEDMPRRVPDISKIRQCIGYEPKVHLDGILRNVIDYWRPRVKRPRFAKPARRVDVPAPEPLVAMTANGMALPLNPVV